MRLRHILPITILVLFGTQASAAEGGAPAFKAPKEHALIGTPLSRTSVSKPEQKWYYPYEISDLDIKQTNDGTGIIRGIHCGECDYKIVTITPDTKVIVNGNEVELLRARERAGQEAFIEFDRETAEVKHIYWSE